MGDKGQFGRYGSMLARPHDRSPHFDFARCCRGSHQYGSRTPQDRPGVGEGLFVGHQFAGTLDFEFYLVVVQPLDVAVVIGYGGYHGQQVRSVGRQLYPFVIGPEQQA